MSVIVDYTYYVDTYKGGEVDETSFPALCAHASRMIGAMARWQVDEGNIDSFPSLTQTLYRLAVCSQIDFLGMNGLESVVGGSGLDSGFTVGKVTVHGQGKTGNGGVMSADISPAAVLYLEQSGLMYPGVPVGGQVGA